MKRLVRLETSRLILRPIEESDFGFLYETMNGPSVRSVWEHEFERKDIEEWIERRKAGYRENGYDYMLALHRETGEPVGQAGLLKERLMDKQVLGIGYIMSERHMGKGYATECARGLAAAAFEDLGQKEIYCDIRPGNLPSIAVAKKLGMEAAGSFEKLYHGMEMLHIIYRLKKEGFLSPCDIRVKWL